MTSEPLARTGDPAGVRGAVRDVPAYPFTPVDAPIKLAQNESPHDFPEELKALAAERMLARPWNRYPDLHADTLRERIAAFEGWDPEGVVVTPGSNVLIKLLTELAGRGWSAADLAGLVGANVLRVLRETDAAFAGRRGPTALVR